MCIACHKFPLNLDGLISFKYEYIRITATFSAPEIIDAFSTFSSKTCVIFHLVDVFVYKFVEFQDSMNNQIHG